MRAAFSALLLLAAATAPPLRAQSVNIIIGTRFESFGVIGAEKEFTLAPGARLYAWLDMQRVGAPTALTVIWKREGREMLRHTLQIRADHLAAVSLYAFDADDGGIWTVQVLSPTGAELGSARFTVTVAAPASAPHPASGPAPPAH